MGFKGEGKGGGQGKVEFFGSCYECGHWGALREVFAPRAKARGKQGGQKGEQEGWFNGESWRKGYKGFSKGGKSAGGKDSPWAKDRGHISRGARGKELGKVCTASAWTSTRRA